MKKILFSIIVPVYNKESVLKETLESIKNNLLITLNVSLLMMVLQITRVI